MKETCPCICRNMLCAPVKFPVCLGDCIGRFCLICWSTTDHRTTIANHPNNSGCCTACVFSHFPLCMPELCMTNGPNGDIGVFWADSLFMEGCFCRDKNSHPAGGSNDSPHWFFKICVCIFLPVWVPIYLLLWVLAPGLRRCWRSDSILHGGGVQNV